MTRGSGNTTAARPSQGAIDAARVMLNDRAAMIHSGIADASTATLSLLAHVYSQLCRLPAAPLLTDLPTVVECAPSTQLLDAIACAKPHARPADEGDTCGVTFALERTYEAMLLLDVSKSSSARTRLGAVYTPAPLARELTRDAWNQLCPTEPPSVLDPACGCGRFLVACAEVARETGGPTPILHGTDLDPCAVFIARALLRHHHSLASDAASICDRIRRRDGLGTHCLDAFDLVLGNPPFMNQLERASARGASQSRTLRARSQGIIKGYADTASAFLHHAITLTRAGGITCMIQPLSVLAARDARPLRAWSSRTAKLESLWVGDTHAFAASVHACALTLRKRSDRATQDAANLVTLTRSVPPQRIARIRATPRTRWSVMAARACGVPNLRLDDSLPTLRNWLDATADFRDAYYALRELVVDAPPAHGTDLVPILNTGLIELGATSWGRAPARLFRSRWLRPAFERSRAQVHPFLSRVLPMRLRPKIILATQTRVIEAFVDERGQWMPTTPLISLTPRENAPDLFTIAAALCSPVSTLVAARRTFGTSMSPRAIKLAAREALDVPIPPDASRLASAASFLRAAASAHESLDNAGYEDGILQFAEHAVAAYGLSCEDQRCVLSWWRSRRTQIRSVPPTSA